MNPVSAIPTILAPRSSRSASGLALCAVAAAALLVAPIGAVLISALTPGQGAWSHLVSTVLGEYLISTLWLAGGVAFGVIVLGVSSAWIVVTYRFPGRSLFEWALILPLAVPGYVIAYAYTDFLQVSGPLQSGLRDITGWRAGEYWSPDIRSLTGAILVFSLVLYPYVYLLARAAFLEQSANLLEAGRLLGRGTWGTFFRVALPLARPAIAAGTSLALMETLADFGAVSYFGVQTFTTGIYRAWMSMGDAAAAAQLSAVLLGLVLVILLAERWNRGSARYYDYSAPSQKRAHQLSGTSAAAAMLVAGLPPALGFLMPASILVYRVTTEHEPLFDGRLLSFAANSLTLAGVTAVVAVMLGVLLAYAARLSNWRPVRIANRLAMLGYAMPGAVIAVGILVPVARLDHWLADWVEGQFGLKVGLIFTGSLIALIYAYLVRFLAVALQSVEAGLAKIRPSMEDAARSLGRTPSQVLARIHAPMMSSSLLAAALIVFVDVMKELPATFAMRPFNFDTLAVQAYHFASDERLAQAAAASLVIVGVSLVPVVLLSRAIARGRPAV